MLKLGCQGREKKSAHPTSLFPGAHEKRQDLSHGSVGTISNWTTFAESQNFMIRMGHQALPRAGCESLLLPIAPGGLVDALKRGFVD